MIPVNPYAGRVTRSSLSRAAAGGRFHGFGCTETKLLPGCDAMGAEAPRGQALS